MDILRFTTSGNVDDGKSTLIGRLLYDSDSLYQNQIDELKDVSQGSGKELDFSLLTDGLKDERKQNITIDVAYRYFNTKKRKFIIADSPGHLEYIKNTITAISNSEAIIILIDAKTGITEQTKRHAYIAYLFGIRNFVICINKMDLVNYSENVFNEIKNEFQKFSNDWKINNLKFIPVSALKGDNIVSKSENMSWYNSYTLLNYLEEVDISNDVCLDKNRFIVQRVEKNHYQGKIISGHYKVGDEITVLPNKSKSYIKSIIYNNQEVIESIAPISVSIVLNDNLITNRGDIIVTDNEVFVGNDIDCYVCLMDKKNMTVGSEYILQHHGKLTKCVVKKIHHKTHIQSLKNIENVSFISLNEIGKISIRTTDLIIFDMFNENKSNGTCILIDGNTNETVGGCIIVN